MNIDLGTSPSLDPTPPTKNAVGAVLNAVSILRYMASNSSPEGVTAIAKATGISASTTFNILRTLQSQEIVSMDAVSKTYQLGIGLSEILAGLISMSPFQLIQPELDRISNETGGQAVLWKKKDDYWVAVANGKMNSLVRIETGLGVHIPLYSGAIGKATAAFKTNNNENMRTIYDSIPFEKKPNFEDFLDQINKTRISKWAFDDGETFRGVSGIASTIQDKENNINLGISTVFVSSRLDYENISAYAENIVKTCERISTILYKKS